MECSPTLQDDVCPATRRGALGGQNDARHPAKPAIDRPALTKLLALPEKMRLCCMVALGYPTHKSHLVEMQNGSVKYYLDEAGDYCVPKRPLSKVLLKTL